MREKEENRRTQESFVGNLKKKKSVLFNEREQERRVMFGGIELSSMVAKGSFSSGNYRSSIKKSFQH